MVLLDLMMPIMDGFSVLEALHADQTTASIPTIMLSAVRNEDTVRRCYGLGARTYLQKPFTPQDLFASIEAALVASG